MDGTEVGLLGAAGVLLVRVIGPDAVRFVRRIGNGGRPTRNGSDQRVDRIVEGLTEIKTSLDHHNDDAAGRSEAQLEAFREVAKGIERLLGRGDPR